MPKKVVIIGAAGMDYNVFNNYFRNNSEYHVVAFTMAAEQNLGTTGEALRPYPKELAGDLYPEGIPTYSENDLETLIKEQNIEEVVFAYSDVSHEYLMNLASKALACGANFRLIAPKNVMIKSKKPVIAVTAVRTGCGKSQTSRWVGEQLKKHGLRVVMIREPMPYGDLVKQTAVRYASIEDFKKYDATVEEMEEYEPHIDNGFVVYAGVDYEKIIRQAEEEADVIIFDGGNNEISFYVPDLLIVVTDPLRAGHGIRYHPGELNLRLADAIIINKEDSADPQDIQKVVDIARKVNPDAGIYHADSALSVQGDIKGKRVLVIEDGPTTTHGGMGYGAGLVAAKAAGAEIVDPKPFLKGSLETVFEEFPHLERVIPAMGYSEEQLHALEETVNATDCDLVVSGTPIDVSRLIKTNKEVVRVKYDLQPKDESLANLINDFVEKFKN
ncbi:GTPase [archaeon]|nr:GTPase [archaeon]